MSVLRLDLLSVLALLSFAPTMDAAAQGSRPNIVFILADDLDVESASHMPRVRTLIADQGVTFTEAFATYPICCPSRASILTGQYPHNHKILFNTPPLGGFAKFRESGERSTIATSLQSGGYRTGLFGKYLNGYPANTPAHVPPGWTEWNGVYDNENYFNYRVNENGTVRSYGESERDYETDVLAEKIVKFIQDAEAQDTIPFFVYFSPYAPHGDPRLGLGQEGPALPAPRHRAAFANAMAPRTPSFNEADVSDKPPALRQRAPLTPGQIALLDHLYRERLRSLLAVDEAVDKIIQVLRRAGELENTFIVFTSDHGYHLGQHRFMTGKNWPYEEDIRVPLFIRGPGVPAKARVSHFALNIDFAPTFADIGGAAAPEAVDGRSLLPVLGKSPPAAASWRQDFLIEMYRPNGDVVRAVRTRQHVYIEHSTGARELYDLRRDPHQLSNAHTTAGADLLQTLAARLSTLTSCAAAACRE